MLRVGHQNGTTCVSNPDGFELLNKQPNPFVPSGVSRKHQNPNRNNTSNSNKPVTRLQQQRLLQFYRTTGVADCAEDVMMESTHGSGAQPFEYYSSLGVRTEVPGSGEVGRAVASTKDRKKLINAVCRRTNLNVADNGVLETESRLTVKKRRVGADASMGKGGLLISTKGSSGEATSRSNSSNDRAQGLQVTGSKKPTASDRAVISKGMYSSQLGALTTTTSGGTTTTPNGGAQGGAYMDSSRPSAAVNCCNKALGAAPSWVEPSRPTTGSTVASTVAGETNSLTSGMVHSCSTTTGHSDEHVERENNSRCEGGPRKPSTKSAAATNNGPQDRTNCDVKPHRTNSSTVESTITAGTAHTTTGPAKTPSKESTVKAVSTTTTCTTVGAGTTTPTAASALAIPLGDFSLLDNGYILTPGRHKININNFLMQCDCSDQLRLTQPGPAANNGYAQATYLKWRSMENLLDRRCFQLAFDQGSDIERFRRLAVRCILEYVRDCHFTTPSVHCAVHNIHRVLLWYINNIKTRLSTSLFACTVAACLRMALKHEETPEKTRVLRETPGNIWQAAGIREDLRVDRSTKGLNKVEAECFNILNNPLTPPGAPDYLERYLSVGGWPDHLVQRYREIALYFVGLAFFSRKEIDNLNGVPPSLLAAGALALGVKVISADNPSENYEFWPERLAAYAQYTTADLRVAVKGISLLLRNKPCESVVLEHFHLKWACYDWK